MNKHQLGMMTVIEAPPPVNVEPIDCSAIIVTYNRRTMLERTIESLLASSPAIRLEVIVVDNRSTDGTAAMLDERFPAIKRIQNSTNVGLTRAVNQALAIATGRCIGLFDNDIIVQPGAIEAMVDYLDANPMVGAVGSKVLNPDGSIQGSVKAAPTPLAALFGRHALLTRLFPHNRLSRRYLIYLDHDFSESFAAGSVSACAMMLRRTAIERAGPMDERFFVYWSDVDWCRAIWSAGLAVHCLPKAVVIHDEHSGQVRQRRPRSWAAIRDFHLGSYRYFRKWYSPRHWHPFHGLALVGLAGRALLILATEHGGWHLRHWIMMARQATTRGTGPSRQQGVG